MNSRLLSFIFAVVLLCFASPLFAGDAYRSPAFDAWGMDPTQEMAERMAMKRDIEAKGGFFPSLGNWFDTTNPGWGLDIQAIGNTLFAVWFTYNPDGTPTWYIIVGQLAAKGGGMSLTGNIDSFTWDPDTQMPTSTVVGSMTIDWADEDSAKVTWTLNGEDGLAGISFTPFAPGIAYASTTGHYFLAITPGWGYTLLTQGDITVLTMYWYKNGEPVWAQGVRTTPEFWNPIWTLNYFFGPGLCPSCLDDKRGPAAKFEADPVVNVQTRYGGPGNPSHVAEGNPVDVQLSWTGTPGDQLGSDPFSDIFILNFAPATTTSITNGVQDRFDPNYDDFNDLAQGLGLGNCLAFQYDPGIFMNVATGSFETLYFSVNPTSFNGLPVYTDANCTQPFPHPHNIENMSQLWGAASGPGENVGDAVVTPLQIAWGGERFGFSGGAGECYTTDRVFMTGARWETAQGVEMKLYGFTRTLSDFCDTGARFMDIVGGFMHPPPGVDITNGIDDSLTAFATYGQ